MRFVFVPSWWCFRCALREQGHAAVDAEHLAVDEFRGRGAEERDGVGLIARSAVADECAVLDEHRRIDGPRVLETARGRGARAETVHADVVVARLDSETPR